MMLAIVGALILIDRMTAYWFTEIIVLIMPVVIIMYTTMHTFKDGLMLCVGLLIISFLLGNFQFTYLIYVPVGVLTGLSYSYGIKRGMDKRRLLMIAIITYVFGELLATFVIYPLLGFPVAQMLEEFKVAMTQAGGITGMDYSQIFSLAGLDFGKVLSIVYVISTVLMGAMEGVLIHLLSVFVLKRFKIKDLGTMNLFDMKPSPSLAYAALIMASLSFFVGRFSNETLYYIMVTLSIIGVIILLYYGYIFVILYGVIVLRRNIGGLVVLACFFVPGLFFALVIMGFLYGAGPLRNFLESRVMIQK